jgi:hypothetical protein
MYQTSEDSSAPQSGCPARLQTFAPRQDLADLGENEQGRSLVIERRGTPKAVLLSIRDYVKLAAPEVLRVIGEGSERNGTSTLTSRQIDQIIKTSRFQKPKP